MRNTQSIQFRIWDKKNKEMIYPCDIHELVFEKKGRWYLTHCKSLGYEYDHEINNVTSHLMQFIGLTDEDNQKIFELDIVNYTIDAYEDERNFVKKNALIEWDEFGVAFAVRDNISSSYTLTSINEIAKFEILGNIDQNPNLVKK